MSIPRILLSPQLLPEEVPNIPGARLGKTERESMPENQRSSGAFSFHDDAHHGGCMDRCKVYSKDSRHKKLVLLFVPFGFVHKPGQKISLGLNRYKLVVILRLDKPVFRNRGPFPLYLFGGRKSLEQGTSNHHAYVWVP